MALGLVADAGHAGDTAAEAHGEEVVDLTPDGPSAWSFRHLTAPVIALFRGTDYVYRARRVRIETTPAAGYVDLFYVRSGFQKRFEQAESPVTVILPSRLDAGPRDAFTVRAFAPGYRQKSVTYKLSDRFDEVNIDLEPLANRLEAVAHRALAGRSSVIFLTAEPPVFRVQEAEDGYSLFLNGTAMGPSAAGSLEGVSSPLLAGASAQQLGEDLMVRLVLADPGRRDEVEIRSRQSYDAPRDRHAFSLDFVPAPPAEERVEGALEALAALDEGDVSGCRLAFDRTLREALDGGALARALRPSGEFTDRYLRAAMRRLGEVSVDGVVDFADGSTLRPEVPIELEMAIVNAAGAKGYLALLEAFVAHLEPDPLHRDGAFKSLVAPELPSAEFTDVLEGARSNERACGGTV